MVDAAGECRSQTDKLHSSGMFMFMLTPSYRFQLHDILYAGDDTELKLYKY